MHWNPQIPGVSRRTRSTDIIYRITGSGHNSLYQESGFTVSIGQQLGGHFPAIHIIYGNPFRFLWQGKFYLCHIGNLESKRIVKHHGIPFTLVSIFLATASMEEVRIPENCLREINSSFHENS